MARSSTSRGVGGVRFLGQYNEELGRVTTRGGLFFPTHVMYREQWKQCPGLQADRETFTASVAAAEAVKLSQANADWMLCAGQATVDSCASFSTGGGVTLTTTTADGDQVPVGPQASTKQSALAAAQFLSQNSPRFSTFIKTGASIAKVRYALGFKLTFTDVPATDDDQCFLRYTDAAGTGDLSIVNWQLVTSRAGTDVFFDTGIAVVASKLYRWEIEIDSTRSPHLYCWAPQAPTGPDGNGGTQTDARFIRREIVLDAASKAPLTTAIALKPFHTIAARGTTPGAKAITLIPDFEVGHLAA